MAGELPNLFLLNAMLLFSMLGEAILGPVISPVAGCLPGNARPVTLAADAAFFLPRFALTPLFFVSKIWP